MRAVWPFLDREGASVVTTALALRWTTGAASATACASRLDDVRRFAAWLSATDPRTEIPPRGLLPDPYRRKPPYVYSDEQVAKIVQQATRLPSDLGRRGQTYATLFGLLATAGLRLSEALALDRLDVDLWTGLLAIRRTKFGKSRFAPIHESARVALQRYARLRDRLVPRPASPAFLLSERGTRIKQFTARYNFVVVSRVLGLRPPNRGHHHGHGPRLHDLRHRLAARTLVRWYREGHDVERELPKHSLLHPTTARGSAGVIARSCSLRSRPGFASPSSQGFGAGTSCSAPARISAATARGASSGARRCAATS